ncbi:MAG: ABC transporter ATP-binding protein [Prevotella sp.]|jgi:ABC-2 type transport system ATP-binding protein
MIRINQLQKHFGDKTAVDIPDLFIKRGEIIGLVGNNGAGKTTFFRLMLDLLKADSGTVCYAMPTEECLDGETPIDEVNPATSEDWKLFVGAYLDEGFLIDFLTPNEYFNFIGQTFGLSSDEIKERVDRFAPFTNWQESEEKKLIRDFSAGNKQKIGIIAAMLGEPKVLLLDEPFNFLDPSSQNYLKKMIQEYNERTHATILVASHNLQHTIETSTRILLMEDGKIIRDQINDDAEALKELNEYFDV